MDATVEHTQSGPPAAAFLTSEYTDHTDLTLPDSHLRSSLISFPLCKHINPEVFVKIQPGSGLVRQ
jgi:hypothetical protein